MLVHVHECKHHPNAHETGSAYVQSIIKELETMADSHASIRILRLIPLMFWRQDHYGDEDDEEEEAAKGLDDCVAFAVCVGQGNGNS